ncbi:MAG: PAS domain-containing protein [Pseudomonadota bacterium]
MIEHRLGDRLTTYWDTIRKDEPMPDFTHFNTSAISDIWQQCILFTLSPLVENKPAVLNFYMIGESLRTLYSSDMVGRSFSSSQRHFQGAALVRRVEEMIANPQPISDVGQFINERSKVVKYRSVMLPFGRGGKVTHVVVGLSWREF